MAHPSLSERLKNMYFGWYTVLAGAVIACWGYGSWYYGTSALFTPLTVEYGWTRAQLSAAFSMRSIEGGAGGAHRRDAHRQVWAQEDHHHQHHHR